MRTDRLKPLLVGGSRVRNSIEMGVVGAVHIPAYRQ